MAIPSYTGRPPRLRQAALAEPEQPAVDLTGPRPLYHTPLLEVERGAPRVRVGVIGYGYWGPNLVRNFSEAPGSAVAGVADLSPARLGSVRSSYPGVELTTDYHDLLADPTVDAIALATPVSTHFSIAMEALKAGKHVLVEKPLAASSEQAARLIDEADRRNLVLMVDHTFVYTGAVQKMRELVETGRLGQIYYYDSVRVNLGLFQHDVSVVWDLAVHDLAIMDYVIGESPCAVAATGIAHVPGQPENTAYLTCFFQSNLIAHLSVNWLAPVKVRRTLLGGDRQMVVYDDLEPSEKIKVYDRGITLDNKPEGVYEMMVGYRTGDVWAPKLSSTEALRSEAIQFVSSIRERQISPSDGLAGLRVVRVLEAATESLRSGGYPIELVA